MLSGEDSVGWRFSLFGGMGAAVRSVRAIMIQSRWLWVMMVAVPILNCMSGCARKPDDASSVSTEAEVSAPPTPAKLVARPPDAGLQRRVAAAIDHVRQRDLLITNSFWTIFHGILCFGPGTALLDRQSGQYVNALDYILAGRYDRGPIRGLGFIPTKDGLDMQMGPTFEGQGHKDQFLCKIAQWNVPIDRPIEVFGRMYTVRDILNETLAHTRRNTELSWTIVGVGWYLGTDASWTNNQGEKLHYTDLIRDELNASVETAACGGTHRLGGLTWALHLHLSRGGKEEGIWKEVADHLDAYQKKALAMQNPDGTFSSNYFRGPGHTDDPQEKIGTTGHILEWLSTVMTDEELKSEQIQKAANVLAMAILDSQNLPIESGALYHATHGLLLYHTRVFGPPVFEDRHKPRDASVTSN